LAETVYPVKSARTAALGRNTAAGRFVVINVGGMVIGPAAVAMALITKVAGIASRRTLNIRLRIRVVTAVHVS
jgi:hypothetical protein